MASKRLFRLTVLLAGAAALGACGRHREEAGNAHPAALRSTPAARQTTVTAYPAPRFPSYLTKPASIDEIMPAVRRLVRAKTGFQGIGLGALESGQSVVLVASASASMLTGESEDLVMQALVRALEERGVKAAVVWEHEAVGVSREDAVEIRRLQRGFTSQDGYMEVAGWIDQQFPDPAAAKTWLRERRPDLYGRLYPPALALPDRLKKIAELLTFERVGAALRRHLEAHPEVRGVFWGKAGSPWLRRAMHPLEDKMLGLLTNDNTWDVMSAIGSYPGDVWALAEEETMDPIVHVSRVHITDPEGTDLSAEIDDRAAGNWARGMYERGHLYLYPTQASGRWAASVVDYPAFQKDGWVDREPMPLANGIIGGTANHTGFFPSWRVRLRDGYVAGVEGGGLHGELLREFLQYPKINDVTFPYHQHKGFWYLYEIASGTHPKGFRNPAYLEQGSLIPERQRSGALHWGLGITLHHNPTAPLKAPEYLRITAEHNLPRDHGFHTHTYFSTYKVHLRNADKWLTLIDRGRLTSLDSPEVRALASRYGPPDELLAEDWIPEIPGINAGGNYARYATDPWPFVKEIVDKAVGGTYEHLYPQKRGSGQTN